MTGEMREQSLGRQRLPVTVITASAGQDSLSEQDYRDIYDEVRRFDEATARYGVPLNAFVKLVHSEVSKAAWSKYHRGVMALNRTMRNELRRAANMALLPPTIAEATAGVHADAAVVQVGSDRVRRVVLVGMNGAMTVYWNGDVSAWAGSLGDKGPGRAGSGDMEDTTACLVTVVTRSRKAVFVSSGLFDRINALRRASGLSWQEVMEAAEATLKAKSE